MKKKNNEAGLKRKKQRKGSVNTGKTIETGQRLLEKEQGRKLDTFYNWAIITVIIAIVLVFVLAFVI
ncbi:hypothetical protein BW727_100458 [Jeotgalibaca dankookensis]|uniref:Uncharacterized protein n=1 Tax=Jeotgalibaca dankookensis TaxID=708126 RepID=A0A1S6IMY7_9LACT|nr:hypothetical protein [Jeotgalibaca dankookensis]AQS52851.1 hypothetical protein BW727_100458 [Jeotgalibaca dankookensis]